MNRGSFRSLAVSFDALSWTNSVVLERAGGLDVRVGVDLAGDDGIDVGEADVVAVEAVCLVYDAEALVVGLDEGDVDALQHIPY